MNRKEFFRQAGLHGAALLAISQLVSCSKSSPGVAGGAVDFTLDLNDPANAQLGTSGGFVYKNGVIVARTSSGTYLAVSQVCTHQGATVQYDGTQNDFFCPVHGSLFAANGAVLAGPASTSLRQYQVSLTGSTPRIYG